MHTRNPLAASLLSAVAISVATLASSAAAQLPAAHFPTNEDLRHTRALADPHLSPDGRFLLFKVRADRRRRRESSLGRRRRGGHVAPAHVRTRRLEEQ